MISLGSVQDVRLRKLIRSMAREEVVSGKDVHQAIRSVVLDSASNTGFIRFIGSELVKNGYLRRKEAAGTVQNSTMIETNGDKKAKADFDFSDDALYQVAPMADEDYVLNVRRLLPEPNQQVTEKLNAADIAIELRKKMMSLF